MKVRNILIRNKASKFKASYGKEAGKVIEEQISSGNSSKLRKAVVYVKLRKTIFFIGSCQICVTGVHFHKSSRPF